MVAFLPLIGLGASLVGGWLGGRKNKRQKGAEKRLDESSALMTKEGQRLGADFDKTGTRLMGQAKTVRNAPGYAQPMNYWSALMGGDRAKMMDAVAPQRRMMAETYRGHKAGINKSRMRGAAKDAALAETERDETANLAGLTQGLTPMAAQQMQGLEGEVQRIMQAYSGLGLNAKATGANVLSQLLGQAAGIDQGTAYQEEGARQQRSQDWGRIGGAVGGMFGDWLGGRGGGGGGGGFNNQMGSVAPTPAGWRIPTGTFAQPFGSPNGGRFLDYNTMMGGQNYNTRYNYGFAQPYGTGF